MPLEQPVMIITGASRGIGAACALLAARRGYAVCINYREREAPAQAVADAIRADGGTAMVVQADVADDAQVIAMFARVHQEWGRLDGLINNAGVLERQMRVEDMDAARVNRILATNVTGPLVCSREAIRLMAPRHGGQGGAIVNVSSAAARLGSAGEYVDYAASKGALDTFTIGLSREVAADKIRVNAVRPGFIYTEMHALGGEPGRVDRLKDSIPLQRGGTPEEVAGAVMWFFSDEAGYTTGSFIEVSGGR
ncbi:SDR family oxidoreductase [Pseudomonadota bacterium AL_CKDN230030165-1A_HGKHYDSX7]